ncbi:hypothetical protein BC936DRAFT_138870, partial [Jimgerdemannia flammicorona]
MTGLGVVRSTDAHTGSATFPTTSMRSKPPLNANPASPTSSSVSTRSLSLSSVASSSSSTSARATRRSSHRLSVVLSLPKSVYVIGENIEGTFLVHNSVQPVFGTVTLYGALASSILSETFLEETAVIDFARDVGQRNTSFCQSFTLRIPIYLEGRRKIPPSAEFPVASIVYTIKAGFFNPQTKEIIGTVPAVVRIVDEGRPTPLPPLDLNVDNLDVRFEIMHDPTEVFRPGLWLPSCTKSYFRCSFRPLKSASYAFSERQRHPVQSIIRTGVHVKFEILNHYEHVAHRPDLQNELCYEYCAVNSYIKILPTLPPSARTAYSDFYYTLEAALTVYCKGRLIQRTLQLQIPIFNEVPSFDRGGPVDVRQDFDTDVMRDSPRIENTSVYMADRTVDGMPDEQVNRIPEFYGAADEQVNRIPEFYGTADKQVNRIPEFHRTDGQVNKVAEFYGVDKSMDRSVAKVVEETDCNKIHAVENESI